MLFFKKKFLDPIRRGEKTQTIRVWKSPRATPGQRRFVPGLGRLLITAVDEVRLSRLTVEDARRDGFPSLAALRRELKAIYGPRLPPGQRLFRVRFTVAELLAARQAASRRRRLQPSRVRCADR